nr:RNA-directed DNA polymerase, eukaryota, nucleotide-binding alpha-beta plait domain protein [Tanacetum cinerariifolium]
MSRDLWNTCSSYGTVVDVFIPTKISKAGKRFAFVRFVKVHNLDRLVDNLRTLWIGSFHLYASLSRFERPPKNSSYPNLGSKNTNRHTGHSQADEVVSETVFGANPSSRKQGNDVNERVHSEDIFGFYDLLQKDN